MSNYQISLISYDGKSQKQPKYYLRWLYWIEKHSKIHRNKNKNNLWQNSFYSIRQNIRNNGLIVLINFYLIALSLLFFKFLDSQC